MKYVVTVNGQRFEIVIDRGKQVWVDGRLLDVDFRQLDDLARCSLLVNHRSYEVLLERAEGDECCMMMSGRSYTARLRDGAAPEVTPPQSGHEPGHSTIAAPLPGLLTTLSVEVGQRVEQGQVVAVLESMKMNLELRSSWSGVVQAVTGVPGVEVTQGQVLITIGPDDSNEARDALS